jgi:hypothetical protein
MGGHWDYQRHNCSWWREINKEREFNVSKISHLIRANLFDLKAIVVHNR